MLSIKFKSSLALSGLLASALLVASGAAWAQSTVNLIAGPSTATMPDGSAVPMWGYTCTGTQTSATCAALNTTATGWSPVVITVPYVSTGTTLTISLTNSLTFSGNNIPTSLVIVGQLGGGLGDTSQRTTTPSPDHSTAQQLTWPIPDSTATAPAPAQGQRVQSFATEVAVSATATALTWNNLRPGTYLIESGTHPSIQGPMGLYGMLIVTQAPASAGVTGTAYPGVTYNAEVPLLLSEIDPAQNAAITTAVNTASFAESNVWAGFAADGSGTSLCKDVSGSPANNNTCYPPAVNYTPLYFLVNGRGFDKTNPSASVYPVAPTGVSGSVLVRVVNAGLRMHVPSIVGALTNNTVAGTAAPTVVPGVALIAEDGNALPGIPRVQSEVFMAAGKTYDLMINAPTASTTATALAFFDRQLSLSAASIGRDAGMLAYIGINGGVAPVAATSVSAQGETYYCEGGQTLTVSDPGKGVLANDRGANGATLGTVSLPGKLTFHNDGTFTYVPPAAPATCGGSFTYLVNGTTTATATITECDSAVQGSGCTLTNAPTVTTTTTFVSNVATRYVSAPPGVLAGATGGSSGVTAMLAGTANTSITLNPDGSFIATRGATTPSVACPTLTPALPAGTFCTSFQFRAKTSQGVLSSNTGTAIVAFLAASNLTVSVLDGTSKAAIAGNDYRWIIEEDRTFYVDPNNTTNTCPQGATCPIVPTFGTNFHTSYMPVVATGCTGPLSCGSGQTVLDPTTGSHVSAVCDIGNGICRPGAQQTVSMPGDVHLDPTKRYYISVLPGDAANPFETGNASGGHGMGGAPIGAGQITVTVLTQPTPFPTAKLTVFVFQDDFPLNGEHDASGGIDVLATNEPGLGGFNITLFDDAGGTGDSTGQMTYDMFNQPLSNSLAGTIDPATGLDACPISNHSRTGVNDPTQTGITSTIVTCPKFEADGRTLSPLAGQAVIANLMPGRYGVVATPGADRIGRGEEWLQTNTLDGQKAHDSFLRIGEPSFFQEFGPAGYHVAIGFANPQIINSRLAGICNGTDPNLTGRNCTNTVKGMVTTERMSRTPDERLFSSGSNDSFAFTQCYVSIGDTDGEDFAFTKCNADGTFTLSGLPDGNWRITVFDQWNDMLVDGLSTPVLLGGGRTIDMGQIAMNQWQANIYTSTFFDINGDGVRQSNEPGLSLVATNIRFRDGSFSNFNSTDLHGNAGFNEVFPLFSWYVIETDSTRYKNTGTHVVYDAGGPADGSTGCNSTAPCGASSIASFMANTFETVSVPNNLRVPGAVYCAGADCTNKSITAGPSSSDPPSACTTATDGTVSCTSRLSTGRIDPAWVDSEGWQGFSGQNSFLEFGKTPFQAGENGGIHGHVVYASTRPFDDPQLLLQLSWEPLVPNVTVNLYQVGTAADGSQTLTLVDTTKTTSWDAWAQGFRSDGVPNMNCPGQGRDTGPIADLFFFSLYNQPNYLDVYNSQHGGAAPTTLPNNSQFKCYDGMHNWNQLQPAPYDGMYKFPSVTARDPVSGSATTTNCTICGRNPFDASSYMLPAGKYVVEVIVPSGYELVKEEDKNILIGDNYIAPATVQFPNLATAVYILPDQAEIAALYNPNNPQNATQNLGALPRHEGDTGSVESFWPCVGAMRIVPDFISLFPQSGEVSPFAGATRPLCDRKLVTLADQAAALAKFYIFTSTHAAAHFTGVITDDFTSEFDPFSPQFGEKFSPPNLPVAIKDWTGNEISRVYSDQWGSYNGLTYSTWEVNPPNPTGYAPTMMVTCMNDPGTGATPDPLFNPAYSQFCYEIPFMPGQTQYMDTPVVPTSAFAGAGYNNPDCSYPAATPAISRVDGDGVGPWVSATGRTLTIQALGDQVVQNNGYSGPSATAAPFNQKTITKHYGFGAAQGTGSVTIGGAAATVTSWSDTTITVTVPSNVPLCSASNPTYQGANATARCGELVITAGNGTKSIDAVTVTVGGTTPTVLAAGQTIQSAIDAAQPGDMIIVPPGAYNELLLMWKPVRLQGVGAASSIINANAHPAGKLDPWRAQVVCLFGLALNGQPLNEGGTLTFADGSLPIKTNPFDPTGAQACGSTNGTAWTGFQGGTNNPQVDRIPLEGIVGWDTTLNGNLAQLLQEPTLMGAYEGAGITVIAKGVRYPGPDVVNPATGQPYPATNNFGSFSDTAAGSNIAHEGQFPVPTVLLSNSAADCTFASNFLCNPSRIDGLSITNSSQGGGGIFVHGWAHRLEISNNRVYNNTGTLTGGIVIGQGESPDALLSGNNGDPIGYNGGALSGFDQQPWTCLPGASGPGNVENVSPPGTFANQQLPYCYNTYVNLHHNAVTRNSSIGDELFSGTPAGAGGVTMGTGADWYKVTNNFICGNLSTGDGGGLSHLGFTWNGDIEHNTILFNQSTNPTIATNGGGIVVMGAAPDSNSATIGGAECGALTDVDCAPGLSDGTGPNLTINANLIKGNSADSGSGGGIRLQAVNGTEVGLFPLQPGRWNNVNITNNIITNNVAGWDGAGISLQDALNVNIIQNTIVSNDTTASSGVLFNTLGAPLASAPGDTNQATSLTSSAPQAAGVVTMRNSAPLTSSLPTALLCPPGHGTVGTLCRNFSVPVLYNDVIWQNRTFYIGVGSLGTGTLNQQNVVALYNSFLGTRAATQPTTDSTAANGTGQVISGGTGACVTASYWDVGVRGDLGPSNHSSGLTLMPTYSVLTDAGDYPGNNNLGANPTVVSQYCNGSRTPPEFKSLGYQVPPGISDATVPNPIFNLTPAATVDEGNNWINMSWGPLAETNPVSNTPLGNYSLASGSPAIDYIPLLAIAAENLIATVPTTDFFGNPRPASPLTRVDVGAVEFQSANTPLPFVAPAVLNFGNVRTTATSAAQTLTLTNPGPGSLTGIAVTFPAGSAFSRPTGAAGGSCGATLTVAAGTCTINVVFHAPATAGVVTSTVSITSNRTIVGSPVSLTGTAVPSPTLTSIAPTSGARGTSVAVTLTGTNFVSGGTTINVSGTGVTVSGTTVQSPTTVTATLTLAPTAGLGARNVTVTTAGGTTAAVTFTVVNPPAPTLASIAPTSGARGTSVSITLTGTNFTSAGTTIAISGTGVSASAITVQSPTSITATFTISGTAARTARTVHVTTPGGTSGNVNFTVN